MPKQQVSSPNQRHPVEQSMRQACDGDQADASGHAAKQDLRHHKELNAAEPEAVTDIQQPKPIRE